MCNISPLGQNKQFRWCPRHLLTRKQLLTPSQQLSLEKRHSIALASQPNVLGGGGCLMIGKPIRKRD